MSNGSVVALLLNPPGSSSGQRTLGAVGRATTILGYDSYVVANLCNAATPTVVELTHEPEDAWLGARADLRQKISAADALIAAWGLGGLTGPARHHSRAQVRWLIEQAVAAGHTEMWTVAGKPRHPSRWHQYVSDKHGRTSGGPFERRLEEVLIAVPLADLSS